MFFYVWYDCLQEWQNHDFFHESGSRLRSVLQSPLADERRLLNAELGSLDAFLMNSNIEVYIQGSFNTQYEAQDNFLHCENLQETPICFKNYFPMGEKFWRISLYVTDDATVLRSSWRRNVQSNRGKWSKIMSNRAKQ